MHFLTNLWFVWIGLFVLAFLNRQFTIHEIRTKGVRVNLIRWYLTQGAFWGSALLLALSILLNVIQFAKS